jgi:hypothetical protein
MIPGISRVGLDPQATKTFALGITNHRGLWFALHTQNGAPLVGVTVTLRPWQAFGSASGMVSELGQDRVTNAEGMIRFLVPQTGENYRYRATANMDGVRILDVEIRVSSDEVMAHNDSRGSQWH